MPNKAVFLDRDNTLIEDTGYLADPEGVRLLPGVELALKSLEQAGYYLVVVTNQSGIARGLLTEDALEAIHERMVESLARKGAHIDEIYYCPYHADGTVAQYAVDSDLRKPNPGMLLQAAEDLDVDLSASWMVGDSPRDIEAGQRAGCRTIRIRTPHEDQPDSTQEEFVADHTVRNLVEAARVILRASDATRHPSAAAPDQTGDDDVVLNLDRTPASGAPESATGVAVPHVSVPDEDVDDELTADDDRAEEAYQPVAEPEPIEDDMPETTEQPIERYDDEPVLPYQPADPEDVEPDEPEEFDEPVEAPAPFADEPATAADTEHGPAHAIRMEILRELRQYARGQETEEFSIWRLVGTIAQVLVFLTFFVTFVKLLKSQDFVAAQVWATITVALQVMSLTLVLLQRRR